MYEFGNPGGLQGEDIWNMSPNLGVTPVPEWMPVQAIYFPFYFNGQLVTHFKVSSTGVLTFDTLAVLVPPHNNNLLPDAQVPDKSICIRGINALATYSSIISYQRYVYNLTSTYRQCWTTFQFFSDSLTGTYYPSSFFSIVLEENTNNIYIVDQAGFYGNTVSLTMGIQINAATACVVPGSPNIGHVSFGGNGSADNVYYEFIHENPLQTDGHILSSTVQPYLRIADAPYTIGATFRNMGTDTVHTLQLHYTINGSSPVSETFTGLSVPCGVIEVLNFSMLFTPADTGEYYLDIWADDINGASDQDTSNDHYYQRIYIAPDLPNRRVLFEEFKDISCDWSGYWTERYDSILGLNFSKASSIKYEDWHQNFRASPNFHERALFYHKWAVPTAYANGEICVNNPFLYAGCPWNATQALIDSLYALPGLFYIQPQLTFNGFTASVSGSVTSAVNFHTGARCKMYITLVEDTVVYATPQGSSGETVFVNTSRNFIPGNSGVYIGTPQLGQIIPLNYSLLLTDTNINISRLSVVVFIQDTLTREIFQCGEAPGTQLCPPVYHTSIYPLCEGDSVNISGNWYSQSGFYPELITDSLGCDSMQLNIVQVHTLSSNPQYNNALLSASISYFTGDIITRQWYDYTNQQIIPGATGSTYTPTVPGQYALILYNQMGCVDTSDIVTVSCIESFVQQNITICQGDSMQFDGIWQSVPGYYFDYLTNVNGCDSVVRTYLTVSSVNPSLTFYPQWQYLEAWPSNWNYYSQWIDCTSGDTLSSGYNNDEFTIPYNGLFRVVVTNNFGCKGESACFSVCDGIYDYQFYNVCYNDSVQVGSNWYSATGNYTDTVSTIHGCDSIIFIDIDVQPDIDTSITVSGDTLIAHENNGYYWWKDCLSGTILSAGFNLLQFVAPYPGNFQAEISHNGCYETTSCYAVIITDAAHNISTPDARIIPNPAYDQFRLEMGGDYKDCKMEIFDISGNLLQSVSINKSSTIIPIDHLSAGNYFLKIYDGANFVQVKMLSVLK